MKLGMERKVCPDEQEEDGQGRDTSTDTTGTTSDTVEEVIVDDKRIEAGKDVATTAVEEDRRTIVDSNQSVTTIPCTLIDQSSPSSSSSSSDAAAKPGVGDEIGNVEVVVIPVHGGENFGGGGSGGGGGGSRDPSGQFAREGRCPSSFSTDSFVDCCRICQQHAEEPLIELGCHCRGELSRAHRSCVEQWFGNKGSNKCEICQHVAENVPAPPAQSAPHFWVWRLGINRGSRNYTQRSAGARFHPLWAALLILIAGLLFDVLISIFLGASALPVNIIIGVLVVLGIGTAARLVVECWHERGLRRNIRRIETNLAHFQGDAHGSALQVQSNLLAQSSIRPLP